MQKDRNFSVGKISMMINIAVFTACALMYDLSTVIYSLIYVAVYTGMWRRSSLPAGRM